MGWNLRKISKVSKDLSRTYESRYSSGVSTRSREVGQIFKTGLDEKSTGARPIYLSGSCFD